MASKFEQTLDRSLIFDLVQQKATASFFLVSRASLVSPSHPWFRSLSRNSSKSHKIRNRRFVWEAVFPTDFAVFAVFALKGVLIGLLGPSPSFSEPETTGQHFAY